MCQSYGFYSSHVWMWELDHKESWVLKSWCFQTVVLENIFESPLDSKKIKPVNPKGNQPWIFTGMTDVDIEAPILWESPDVKSWLIGIDPDAWKDWRQEKETTEDEIVGWLHQRSGAGSRRWWRTGKPGTLQSMGVAKSWTCLSDWTTTPTQK